MANAAAESPDAMHGRDLYARATIEVTARDKDAIAALKAHVPQGARVHVTYLANGRLEETVQQAAALAAAGFEPIPHVAARSMTSQGELNDYLARLVGEAGARRVLLIAGDVPHARGPFAASIDVLRSGALQAAGIANVAFATHPEGHPVMPDAAMESALLEKCAYAAANGLEAELVSQFCFEATPILDHIARLRKLGIAAPVRIGAAAPTSPARLMKFAMRCGVGPSLRALTSHPARVSKLMDVAGPEGLIADLARGFAARPLGDIAGMHFFVFGGIERAVSWLQSKRAAV